jgi:hypothetical protein
MGRYDTTQLAAQGAEKWSYFQFLFPFKVRPVFVRNQLTKKIPKNQEPSC